MLLVEAQEFIKQREDELARVGTVLLQKEQDLSQAKADIERLTEAEKFFKDENQHMIGELEQLRANVKAYEVSEKLSKQQLDEKTKQLDEKVSENSELLVRIEILHGLRNEVARLEQEKDGLQFKRDDKIKQLEKSIKALKKTN